MRMTEAKVYFPLLSFSSLVSLFLSLLVATTRIIDVLLSPGHFSRYYTKLLYPGQVINTSDGFLGRRLAALAFFHVIAF